MATQASVRSIDNAIDASTPAASAPAKANAAPSVNKNIAIGLVEFLNNTEADLVKQGVFEVANIYSVEFSPAALGDSRVAKEGKPLKSKVPMQQAKSPADKVNPESNSVDYSVRTIGITAGQPIVTVIDEIIKNSTYITDQAAYIVDEPTQETKPQKPLGDLMWYKISVETTPILPRDKKRNDYAYNIKYVISAYPINSMDSEYFPESKIRGRHKSYKYWFTGQNTQVLKFEQKFNSLYKTTFNNPKILADANRKMNRDTPGREYQAAVAGSNSTGAEGLTNSIGASAADYLYSPTDIAKCELTIVGDPAWIQQGEAATGIGSLNYNFSAFNADGTINFDAQQIVFDLQWNPGVDYDLTGTGLANPNVSSAAQAIYTYVATECTSKFNKGRFEQDIKGVQVVVTEPAAAAKAATVAAKSERADVGESVFDPGVRPAAVESVINTSGLPVYNEEGALSTSRRNPETGELYTPLATLGNPPQAVNPTAEQVESTVAYQNALSAGATPEEAAVVSQQSLGASGAGVSTTPLESTAAYQNALAAGATPEEALIVAQRSIGTAGTAPIQQISRET
jgi:hypothetical protein